MTHDVVHLIALGKPLRQYDGRTGIGRIELLGDAHRDTVVDRHDLTFEIIARGIDDADMLAWRKPEHAGMLEVVGAQAERKARLGFASDCLVVEEEMMQRHGFPFVCSIRPAGDAANALRPHMTPSSLNAAGT